VSDLYSTYAGVWDREFKNLYCGQIGPNFHVRDEVLNQHFGVFHVPGEWRWGVNGNERIRSGEWGMENGGQRSHILDSPLPIPYSPLPILSEEK
jgi:hypothetical protein